MSVYGIAGLTGSGKTYVMTRMGIEMLRKAKPHVKLYATYHITCPELQDRIFYFRSLKVFYELENAIVLLDDAPVWFNSRNWNNLPPEVQIKIIEHRKDCLKIICTAQFWDGVDKNLRENAHRYYEVNKIFGKEDEEILYSKPWGVIRLTQFPPRRYDKIKRKVISTQYYLIRKKYVDLYNTFEKVQRLEKEEFSKGEERTSKKEEVKGIKTLIEKEREITAKRAKRARKIKVQVL